MRNQAELPLLSFRFTSSYVSFLSPSADRVVSRYDLKRPRQLTRDTAFRLPSLLPHAFSSLRDRSLGSLSSYPSDSELTCMDQPLFGPVVRGLPELGE